MRSAVRTLLGLVALSACARPTEAELEARYADAQVEQPDAGEADAMGQARHDAAVATLDAALDTTVVDMPAEVIEDAQVDASGVPVVDANVPPASEDAGEPLTCDLSPCQGHCPLGNECCSPLGTCGCQVTPEQPCVLPPAGTN